MVGRRRILIGAASLPLWTTGARAQAEYPSRPIKLIVPYPAGGSTDILARAVAELLGQQLGQPIVVDNRPGAATNIGTEAAIHSPSDGYTVYFGTSGLASNPHFGPTPNFDAFKSLTAVGPVSSMSFMVAASPNFPADDAAGLVALARARPGKVSIGSGSLQVQVAQLTRRAGIDLMHVPYKGGAQAAADAIGGHVDTVIALVPALISSIQNGKLKPIGIAAPSRAAGLPQVPTFTERGVPANINLSWFGLFVPTGTPAPIVSRLGAALRTAVTNPGLVSRMTAQGVDMTPGSAQDLAETLKRDYAEYGRLAQELK